MGVGTIITILFKGIDVFMRWMGAKDEQMKWLADAAESLNEKGWTDNKFILELEEARRERLTKRMDAMVAKSVVKSNKIKSFVTTPAKLLTRKPTRNFKVLAMAASQIGTLEWKKGSNPKVEEYLDYGSRKDNKDSGLRDEVPWCAGFVGWCLEKVGMGSTNSLMARSYEKWGVSVKNVPLPGDIVTFWRKTLKSGYGHVGIFLGYSDGKAIVLGGNQRDSVNVTLYQTDKITDIRRSSKARKFSREDLNELQELAKRIISGQRIDEGGKVV